MASCDENEAQSVNHAFSIDRYEIINTMVHLETAVMEILGSPVVTLNLEGFNISRSGSIGYIVVGVFTGFATLQPQSNFYLIDFTIEDPDYIKAAVLFLRALCTNPSTLKIVHNSKQLGDCINRRFLRRYHEKMVNVFDVTCFDRLMAWQLGRQVPLHKLAVQWGVFTTLQVSSFAAVARDNMYWFNRPLSPHKRDEAINTCVVMFGLYRSMAPMLSSAPYKTPIGETRASFLDRMYRLRIECQADHYTVFFTFEDMLFMSQLCSDYISSMNHAKLFVIKNADNRSRLIGSSQANIPNLERETECRIIPVHNGLLVTGYYLEAVTQGTRYVYSLLK
jgi:hypothetical protein